MNITINDAKLKFKGDLTKRSRTTAILLHHMAGIGDIHDIHREHLKKGWSGCGYNFFVRLDGSVWLGRGWDAIGAHAGLESGYNGKSIGICFEGNYQTDLTAMPAAQYNAGVELIKMALQMFPSISEIKGHKEVYATACPGQYFPLAKFKAVTASTATKATDESEEEEDMIRYKKLSDIPNDCGFQDVIETLMNAKIINGDGTDKTGNNDVIDLSHDQVRSLVFEYRGGAFDRKLIAEGMTPAVKG